jgi:hypothetical protein
VGSTFGTTRERWGSRAESRPTMLWPEAERERGSGCVALDAGATRAGPVGTRCGAVAAASEDERERLPVRVSDGFDLPSFEARMF